MAHLYHPTYTRKIPAGAKRCTHQGRKAVTWLGRDHMPVIGVLCPSKPGRCEVESRMWWIEYKDESGETRLAPGSRDQQAAADLMAQIVRRVEQVKAGILPRTAADAKTQLSIRAEEYRDHLKALRRTRKRYRTVHGYLVTMLDGLGWRTFGDIDPRELTQWLAERRATCRGRGPRADEGVGVETTNTYLGAMKAFSRWLSLQLKCFDPLAELRRLRADADLRHVRRAVNRGEFTRLLEAAKASRRAVNKLPGLDRWALYLVASMTGLRASELASLSPESIDLGAGTVEVEAAFAKARRRDLLPLAQELMREVRGWLEARPAGRPLWPGSWPRKAAHMLRVDLEVAEIPYYDSRGRVFDFHSLRGQFITDLARAGVSITLAQRLARHSSPALTSRHYTHLELHDLQGAVDRLGPSEPKKGKRSG